MNVKPRANAACLLIVLSLLGSAVLHGKQSSDASEKVKQAADAFDQLPGTWAMRKDGFSSTVQIEPIFGGHAFQETVILDENNLEVATSIYTYDARQESWTKTWFNNVGARATFVGAAADGLALEMISYSGRAMDPVRSRLLYLFDDTESWTMDWQSREDAESAWTPREVPYVHRRVERPAPPAGEGRIAFISKRTGNWEIYTMAPDGSDVVNLSNHEKGDHFPKWIAGGSRLAFRSQRGADDGGWQRWEIDIDGTDLERTDLPEGLGNPDAGTFPQVHPSGSYLVYAVERDGELEMYISRFDGGGERPLAHAPGPDYSPSWSPDGGSVLFISERDGNSEIYVVKANGEGLTRLTENAGKDRYSRWSPDGEHIVFASDRDTGESLELYVMRKDGSDVRRLTHNDGEDGEPSWSPDGSKIVFRSNASGNPEVCVVDLASGTITNLTNDPAYDGEPVWSPPIP